MSYVTIVGHGLGRQRPSVILAWGLGGWDMYPPTPPTKPSFKPIWRPRRHR